MNKTIFMALLVGIVTVVAMTTAGTSSVIAQGQVSCPHPGQCTCNPATGVMTDHAMPPPFNKINNGCTEDA
jgi:hypothetical protein